jgi:hypothetical protein
MKDAGKENEYQRWLDFARRRAGTQNSSFLRITNQRYAKEATLEERLTLEDKQLLEQMGISL